MSITGVSNNTTDIYLNGPTMGPADPSNMQDIINELGQLLSGSGTPGTPAPPSGSGGSSSPVASAYNQLMQDLSANGTSGTTLQNDAANLESALQSSGMGNSALMTATNNMVNSLGNGTFSQQGSQGALEGAASQAGLQGPGILAPQIDGAAGATEQNAGLFNGGTNPQGSLGANVNILNAEMAGNAPTSQIINNATALKNEATQAGNSGLASAAQNIINSLSDGTYSAQGSQSALTNALNAG